VAIGSLDAAVLSEPERGKNVIGAGRIIAASYGQADQGSDVIARLLAPLPLGVFFDAVLGRAHRRISGPSERFAHLLPWRDLDELLSKFPLSHGRISVVVDGRARPIAMRGSDATFPRLDVAALYALLAQGATLVVNNVELVSQETAEVSRGLSAVFGTEVNANLYLALGRQEGLGVHYDAHDVFVAQLDGSKRWELYGPTDPHPRRPSKTPRPAGKPAETITMQAGDLLYLPRGHWHRAVGQGEASRHLTFAVASPTGVHLLGWLFESLADDPLLREDLPRVQGAESRRGWLDRFRKLLLSRTASDDLLEQFFAMSDASMPPRTKVNLLELGAIESLWETKVRLAADGAALAECPESREHVWLRTGGKQLRFPATLVPLLSSLLTLRAVCPPDFVGGALEAGVVKEAVGRLFLEGMLQKAPASVHAG
jgi:hypothetical protein